MASMADLYRTKYLEISTENIAEKIELNGRVMRSTPQSPVAYAQAILLALSGQQGEAELQMSRAIWSHPHKFNAQLKRLRVLAQKDPAHFSELLKFSIKTYKERQDAVRNR